MGKYRPIGECILIMKLVRTHDNIQGAGVKLWGIVVVMRARISTQTRCLVQSRIVQDLARLLALGDLSEMVRM